MRSTSAIGISAVLVALGGVLGLVGIRNPRRVVRCEDCAGGQIAGQPLDAAREHAAGAAGGRRTYRCDQLGHLTRRLASYGAGTACLQATAGGLATAEGLASPGWPAAAEETDDASPAAGRFELRTGRRPSSSSSTAA